MFQHRESWLARYLRHRRKWEVVAWTLWLALNAAANSVVTSIDLSRRRLPFDPWEPAAWEFSSAALLLVLLPGVFAFERRFPFHFSTWRRVLPWHVLASIVFSVVHVLGMAGIRKLVYAAAGSSYDFGNWPRELMYEFLKDARTYVGILVVVHFYRLVLLRLQGEARLLAAPDVGPPVEAVCPPPSTFMSSLATCGMSRRPLRSCPAFQSSMSARRRSERSGPRQKERQVGHLPFLPGAARLTETSPIRLDACVH